MKSDPLYKRLAQLVDARLRCMDSGKTDWKLKHEREIERLCREHLPHGSGFDNGTKINFDLSSADRLVFDTSFHHMDEHGGYDGWTEHMVTVTPSLAHDFMIRIGGKNRNDIKEYMHECFNTALGYVPSEEQKQTA
jgi:hypothetical protein